jgi:hypothetical protein
MVSIELSDTSREMKHSAGSVMQSHKDTELLLRKRNQEVGRKHLLVVKVLLGDLVLTH